MTRKLSGYRIRVMKRRLRPEDWVLVVDDNPLSARATARLVRATSGMAVRVAPGLAAIRERLSETQVPPKAIILDYELGFGETGLMALRLIRSLKVRAPCAFFTGAVDKLRRHGGRQGIPVFARSGSPTALSDWVANQRLEKTG